MDGSLLVLEDEGTMHDVVVELRAEGIPVREFNNTPLASCSYNVTDPEVMLYARAHDMIVFTPDTANPSFTDITVNDLRPPDVVLNTYSQPSQVDIDTSLQTGTLDVSQVDPNKHSVSNGTNGHNGVIRMFQLDYMNSQNAASKIAVKVKRYLTQRGVSPRSQVKDIRI